MFTRATHRRTIARAHMYAHTQTHTHNSSPGTCSSSKPKI